MAFVQLPGATIGKVQGILLDKPKRCRIADLHNTVDFFCRRVGGVFERRRRCGDDPLIRSADRLRSAVVVDRSGSTVGAAVLGRVERAAGRG